MTDMDLLEHGLKIYAEIMAGNSRSSLNPLAIAPPQLAKSLDWSTLLQKCDYVPRQTAVLGLCADGFPMMFDLTDSRPGSILITSEIEDANRNLLQIIVKTGCFYNSVDDFAFSVVTTCPEAWQTLLEDSQIQPHLLKILPAWEEKACEWIIHEAERAEQRHMGRHVGGPRLLLIDGFEHIAKMDFDVQRNLDWLMHYGPEVKVWLVASLESNQLETMNDWLNIFQTWITGRLNQADNRLSEIRSISIPHLTEHNQFAIALQNRWLSFDVPELE
jgi:hypothetical protein